MGVAVAIADEQIKIAIVVCIRKGQAGSVANIADSEGIGDIGVGVGGIDGARESGIPEKEGGAVVTANEEIKIAIVVGIRKSRAGPGANIADSEGIGGGNGVSGSCFFWGGSVSEQEGIAVAIADEEIEIAITVSIRESRFGPAANIADSEWIDCGSGVGGSGGARVGGIHEKEGVAFGITDEEIKITIVIGIREGRCRSDGGSGVPEKEGVAEAIADEQIQIAIAVGVREGQPG